MHNLRNLRSQTTLGSLVIIVRGSEETLPFDTLFRLPQE
jgi:hypothetical protein